MSSTPRAIEDDDSTHEAVAVLSPGGTILEVNRRWELLLDTPRDQMVGRHIGDVAPAAGALVGDHPRVPSIAPAEAGLPASLRRSDGRLVHLEFSNTVVPFGGEQRVLVLAREVGERLRQTEQLRQTQKMEALGRLAGGIAHDVNNVLAAVMTYAQFLEDSLSADDARQADAVEIKRAAQRGASLTRRLLLFRRQERQQPRVLDLNQVVSNLLKMLRILIGEDVEIETRFEESLPKVYVDAGLIEQVVMNLAINARDGMPRGGTLRIETSNRTGRVELVIADNRGSTSADARRSPSDSAALVPDSTRGTSLGLTTIFGIVKECGGDVRVERAPGRGTTFSILLPAARGVDAEKLATVRLATSARGGETVLLIEDDESLRSALERALHDCGYTVVAAKTGDAGLEACLKLEGRVHLLVSDVVLPGMNGPQIALRFRERYPDAKVLFMSGYTDTAAYPMVPAGGPDFLPKPFAADALMAKVRSLLDERGRR